VYRTSVGVDTCQTVLDTNVSQCSQYVAPLTDTSIEVVCDWAMHAAIAKIFKFGRKNEDFTADGVD
jgi:hypothetical protein